MSAQKPESSLYDYKSGLCLLFNHLTYAKDRHTVGNGTNVDRDALRSFFEGIGFTVPAPFEDFTLNEIFTTLDSYANNDDHFDCLVCIFLTHGIEDTLAA
ncbi:caspase-8-like protein, partial [Leptotrombidium deliense]